VTATSAFAVRRAKAPRANKKKADGGSLIGDLGPMPMTTVNLYSARPKWGPK